MLIIDVCIRVCMCNTDVYKADTKHLNGLLSIICRKMRLWWKSHITVSSGNSQHPYRYNLGFIIFFDFVRNLVLFIPPWGIILKWSLKWGSLGIIHPFNFRGRVLPQTTAWIIQHTMWFLMNNSTHALLQTLLKAQWRNLHTYFSCNLMCPELCKCQWDP